MKFTFAIALLAAVTIARRGGRKNQDEFLDFAVKEGKNYQSVGEFQKREKNFEKNKAKVDRMNERAEKLEKKRARRADKIAKRQAKKLAKFANNFTSDLDDDEFRMLLGLSELPDRRLLDDVVPEEDSRRHLADNIDWVAAGKMAPMKNQGQCGSCWSFAAGTALEGSHAIKYSTTPERLSEQSAVDCTARTCQTGGWMNDAWNFWKDKGGAPSNAAYPYTGKNQDCQNDKLNKPVAQVSSYKWVNSNSAAADLQDGPMTIALEAGSDCFRYYDGGILDAEEAADLGCGNAWDHAVVLVAFTNAVDGTGDQSCTKEQECTSIGECWTEEVNCRVVEEAKCIDKSTCITNRGKCNANEANCTQEWKDAGWNRRATTTERASQTCGNGQPTVPNKKGKPNKQCDVYKWFRTRCSVEQDCTEAVEECDVIEKCPDETCEEVERCTSTEGGTEGTPAFWTIQNSWSKWWGDNGFIKIEATDDDMGVLGMQYYMQQVFAA